MFSRFRRAAVIAGFAAASVATAPNALAEAPPASDEVVAILLPGQYMGALPYQPFAGYLEQNGVHAKVLDLPGFDLTEEPKIIASEVERARAEHPEAQIALVGHSIGGITSRWYLKELGGHPNVDTYIAIGSPQYGSPGGCGAPVGADVCPGTEYMNTLNAGDDTPGDTAYYNIRSEREWADGNLDGGQCRVTPIRGFQPTPDLGLEHTFEGVDPRVWEATLTALGGECDGEFVDVPDGELTADGSLFPYRR